MDQKRTRMLTQAQYRKSQVILVFEDGWLQENLKLKNR